ncbi:MAG: guanylate kinase, partial [Thermoguttaceae bacterium]
MSQSPLSQREKFQPRVVVLSGPSGAGKTTVVHEVLRRISVPLARSVSATTRPPRDGEIAGVDYHFLTNDEFQLRRQRGDFLECCQVFGKGYWYGTLWSEINARFQERKWVLLNIDVQ